MAQCEAGKVVCSSASRSERSSIASLIMPGALKALGELPTLTPEVSGVPARARARRCEGLMREGIGASQAGVPPGEIAVRQRLSHAVPLRSS